MRLCSDEVMKEWWLLFRFRILNNLIPSVLVITLATLQGFLLQMDFASPALVTEILMSVTRMLVTGLSIILTIHGLTTQQTINNVLF